MFKRKTFSTEFAGRSLIVETGHIAQQAHGSCTVRYGDTVVLAAVCRGEAREGVDFFPLTVDYEEKLYAAGKIKGSRFIKREGRPSDEAVLVARMIDRSVRPLFKETERRDVQLTVTTLSYDNENDSDVAALLAGSIALAISPIPWNGPVAGVRVGRINGEMKINPLVSDRSQSDIDFIVVGTKDEIVMIEAGGKQVTEDDTYSALEYAHKSIKNIDSFIQEIIKEVGLPKDTSEPDTDPVIREQQDMVSKKVKDLLLANISDIFGKKISKEEYQKGIGDIKKKIEQSLKDDNAVSKELRVYGMKKFDIYIDDAARDFVLLNNKRIDGRVLDQVRDIEIELDIVPRPHGSALFKRGETQVLSVVTLGSPGDAQIIDGMEAEFTKRYMHHYNFPGFSVGEVRPQRSTNRREIGHGALAEKAVEVMLPDKEKFPYTIRVVSEVLMSNGSSSQASICGSSLALMAAGVPIESHIAGIAIGLYTDPKDKNNRRILTDIQGAEDHGGDMDFKVGGTRKGITALQLDIKLGGISLDVCKEALSAARAARFFILDLMEKVIPAPRTELSPHAPRIFSMKIDPAKIREVIGSGGKVINGIIEKTGVQIDIEDDGSVFITSETKESGDAARTMVEQIVAEVVLGEIYSAKVVRIADFGAFVQLNDFANKDAMVHVSELAWGRTNKVTDVVNIGDVIKVKIIGIDQSGKVAASLKETLPRPANTESSFDRENPRERTPHTRRDSNSSHGRGGRDKSPYKKIGHTGETRHRDNLSDHARRNHIVHKPSSSE